VVEYGECLLQKKCAVAVGGRETAMNVEKYPGLRMRIFITRVGGIRGSKGDMRIIWSLSIFDRIPNENKTIEDNIRTQPGTRELSIGSKKPIMSLWIEKTTETDHQIGKSVGEGCNEVHCDQPGKCKQLAYKNKYCHLVRDIGTL